MKNLDEAADGVSSLAVRPEFRRVKELLERLAADLRTKDAAPWARVDLLSVFDTELDLPDPARRGHRLASLRGVLILAPVLITWWGIYEAIQAYRGLLQASAEERAPYVNQSFLQLDHGLRRPHLVDTGSRRAARRSGDRRGDPGGAAGRPHTTPGGPGRRGLAHGGPTQAAGGARRRQARARRSRVRRARPTQQERGRPRPRVPRDAETDAVGPEGDGGVARQGEVHRRGDGAGHPEPLERRDGGRRRRGRGGQAGGSARRPACASSTPASPRWSPGWTGSAPRSRR